MTEPTPEEQALRNQVREFGQALPEEQKDLILSEVRTLAWKKEQELGKKLPEKDQDAPDLEI